MAAWVAMRSDGLCNTCATRVYEAVVAPPAASECITIDGTGYPSIYCRGRLANTAT